MCAIAVMFRGLQCFFSAYESEAGQSQARFRARPRHQRLADAVILQDSLVYYKRHLYSYQRMTTDNNFSS